MKKTVKKKKGLFDYKFNIIFDERLDNIKPGPNELKKVAEATERLKKLKMPAEYYAQIEKKRSKS